MSTPCQRAARVSTEKKAARVSVPKSVPLRTAVQLFICVLFGMANMICYGHYKDSDVRGEDDWWQWPTHGWPPKASFQLITYVFLAEASVGMQASKIVYRIIGTVVGALAGYIILVLCNLASDPVTRDCICALLTALCLA